MGGKPALDPVQTPRLARWGFRPSSPRAVGCGTAVCDVGRLLAQRKAQVRIGAQFVVSGRQLANKSPPGRTPPWKKPRNKPIGKSGLVPTLHKPRRGAQAEDDGPVQVHTLHVQRRGLGPWYDSGPRFPRL